MTYLLLISVLSAVRDFIWFMHGSVRQAVNLYTVFVAGAAFYFAVVLRVGRVFRIGAFLLGLGAAIRALTFYLHASDEAQRLAQINDVVLSLAASGMLLIGTVQWFRTVCRVRQGTSNESQ